MKSAHVPERDASRWTPQFGHFVLITEDVDRLASWYCAVLEMDMVLQTDRLAFLTFDGFHHRLVIAKRKAGTPAATEDRLVDHIAFKCSDHNDLAVQYARLKSKGHVPARSTNHGMITSLYYPDPDGTKIELYADNFPTIAALNEWFATGAFERDPIGADIDFEDAAVRLAAGEAAASVFAPPQT
ncbi:VOC family protein [Yoonia sp. 2307UL14-13]|uniref:VOC family protein n=1 Tax=Yoonia sp. 2307UL14-13 TaxID=3126506 RepID=UPI0030994BAC